MNDKTLCVWSYTYEEEEGIFPESQFVFDLELPADFQPRVGDGEVQEFYFLPMDKVGNKKWVSVLAIFFFYVTILAYAFIQNDLQ